MTFWAIILIFFAVRRLVGRGYRRREWRERMMAAGGWRPYVHMHYRRGVLFPTPYAIVPAAPAPPAESQFDVLKRRYVKGELSDEQYERELDDLLKTPEGRGMVN